MTNVKNTANVQFVHRISKRNFCLLLILLLVILTNNHIAGADSVDSGDEEQQQKDEFIFESSKDSNSNANAEWLEEVDDEASLLDAFGEAAKDFLTKRIIPATDASCNWYWRYLRCESYCFCSLQPTWGDYHLGRSCRKRAISIEENDDEQLCHMPPDNTFTSILKNHVEPFVHKIDMDWKGRMTLIKGGVCDTWLSANEYETKLDTTTGTYLEDTTIYGSLLNHLPSTVGFDDDALPKPLRVLRRVLQCNSGKMDEIPNIGLVDETVARPYPDWSPPSLHKGTGADDDNLLEGDTVPSGFINRLVKNK